MSADRARDGGMAVADFAIQLNSISELFWPFDARPVVERALNSDVRWALLDEWDRVREGRPTNLTIIAPVSERDRTDEAAVRTAIRTSLGRATEPLWRVDPLTRQERIAFRLGILGWIISIALATAIDQVSDDVIGDVLSQGVVLIGWVALWAPASRLLTEVLPHRFNRRRIAEFADIDVRFAWTE